MPCLIMPYSCFIADCTMVLQPDNSILSLSFLASPWLTCLTLGKGRALRVRQTESGGGTTKLHVETEQSKPTRASL